MRSNTAGVLGREETQARDEGDRAWSPVAASQERDTRDGPQTPEAAGGEEGPPPAHQREYGPADPLALDFWPPDLWGSTFLWL